MKTTKKQAQAATNTSPENSAGWPELMPTSNVVKIIISKAGYSAMNMHYSLYRGQFAQMNGDGLKGLLDALLHYETHNVHTEFWTLRVHEKGHYGVPVISINMHKLNHKYSEI